MGPIQLRSRSADRISQSEAEAAAMSWSRRFDEPIELPNGNKLLTAAC